MKKTLTLFALLLSAIPLFAQIQTAPPQQTQTATNKPGPNDTIISEVSPPANMEAAFNKMFKGATDAHWDMSTPESPIVTFIFEGKKMQALYADDGSMIWKETDMTSTEFPKAANDYLATVMNPHEITRYFKFEGLKSSDLEVEMKCNEHLYWFQFDMDGKLISRKLLK